MEKENKIIKWSEEIIKKFDIFVAVQLALILEVYYLGINSLLNIAINVEIPINIPSMVSRYNNLIFNYFKEWNSFVLLLSIGLVICGICFGSLNKMPILKNYKIIIRYGDSGFYIGAWMFLIYITYILYLRLNYFFILCVPLICLILNGIKRLLQYIKENPDYINILWN